MDWLNTLFDLVVPALIGAATAGIPLWVKLRRANIKLDGERYNLDRRKSSELHELETKKQIDAEAEWKRILEFRDLELQRLRDRDEQQERQLTELRTQNLECAKRDARNEERINNQGAEIKYLKDEILQLKTRLTKPRRKKHDVPKDSQSPGSSPNPQLRDGHGS